MKQLIAANWKMNGTPEWVSKVDALAAAPDIADAELLICPPHALVGPMAQAAKACHIAIGAQDCSQFDAGAHTGETDAALLASLGATYVIVGHSERRARGEADREVCAKADRAVAVGLRPIICVGESLAQRESGTAQSVVAEQLRGSLPNDLPESGAFDIAYEPIWAIGTGRTATARDIADMHGFIRKTVGGEAHEKGPRILYGGSVKPDNAAEILATPQVGGALVGGASLDMDSFAQIARAAKRFG